jgi:hypothetical protein
MDRVLGTEPASVAGTQRARALLVALLCVIYLLNLSGGWIEMPDCLPVVGNLDEAAATVVLMRCLQRLGFDAMPSRR